MCTIAKLTSVPCTANPSGIQQVGYIVPVEEITADPDYVGTSSEGDYVRATDNFDFTGAGTGYGFFRSFPILIDKGAYKLEAVGGKGSKQWKESFSFTIQGIDAAQLEFTTRMLNIPGVFLCTDKNSKVHAIGRKNEAAFVESSEGGSGEGPEGERVINVVVSAYTSRPMIYEAAIDIVANA
jgi:hypothetical protein